MYTPKEKCFEILYDVFTKYNDFPKIAEEAKQKCEKVLKSYNTKPSTYGMYYPDPVFYRYFRYRGRITKSDTRYTFKYYYQGEKVLLTEHYSEKYNTYNGKGNGIFHLIEYIFYFYYDEHIDIIIYNPNLNKISSVGRVIYINDKINSFIKSLSIIGSKIDAYDEFVFIDNSEFVFQKHYYTFNYDGKFEEHESEHKSCEYLC